MIKIVCYHPLKGFILGVKPNGKKDLKIVSNKVDHLERIGTTLVPVYSSSSSLFASAVYREAVDIPCGKCIGCRLNYSREWATRCMFESLQHESNYFLTLTYDDSHLYKVRTWNDDGVLFDAPSLRKKDFQDFIKRLRDRLDYQKIKYYACGEYGTTTFRPHYHAIIFGLKLDDLVFYKRDERGYSLYTSNFLNSVWKKGYVIVGEVNFDTCAYTARYVLKKLESVSGIFPGMEKEFSCMSTKPAIGKDFFDKYKTDLFKYQYFSLPTSSGSKNVTMPRYYLKQLEKIDLDFYESFKEHRKEVMSDKDLVNSTLSQFEKYEQLLVDELNFTKKVGILKERSDL